MRRTRIKICGICRPQDARLAADAGADAIGLVFCPASPRNLSVEQAREILARVPPFVTPVGLFVDANGEPFYFYAKFAPYHEEWKKTFDVPFMKQVGLLIETHLPAREKYEMYLKRLHPDKK